MPMKKMTRKELISILKSEGFKITPQRLAVCFHVLKTENHLSADEIYSDLKEDYPSLSKATVYKTLNLLADLNLVSQQYFSDGIQRFDSNQNSHVNVICSECGKIIDFEDNLVDDFWEKLEQKIGRKSLKRRIDFITTCNNCQI